MRFERPTLLIIWPWKCQGGTMLSSKVSLFYISISFIELKSTFYYIVLNSITIFTLWHIWHYIYVFVSSEIIWLDSIHTHHNTNHSNEDEDDTESSNDQGRNTFILEADSTQQEDIRTVDHITPGSAVINLVVRVSMIWICYMVCRLTWISRMTPSYWPPSTTRLVTFFITMYVPPAPLLASGGASINSLNMTVSSLMKMIISEC